MFFNKENKPYIIPASFFKGDMDKLRKTNKQKWNELVLKHKRQYDLQVD